MKIYRWDAPFQYRGIDIIGDTWDAYIAFTPLIWRLHWQQSPKRNHRHIAFGPWTFMLHTYKSLRGKS